MTLIDEIPPERSSVKRPALAPFFAIVWFAFLTGCTTLQREGVSEERVISVAVKIDPSVEHQKISGFGATSLAGIMVTGNGVRDLLSTDLRAQALKAVYEEVGLNLGSIQLWQEPRNDNEDPSVINRDGFRWEVSDAIYEVLVRPARPYGFVDFSLGLTIDMRHELVWMKELRENDYSQYLDEVAEYVVAGVSHWWEISGTVPRLITLFNEPLSGNRELQGGSIQEVVDIINYAGKRLHEEGFSQTKFIVPAEETVEKSIDTSRAILADKTARSYIGALAYHAYPYDSAYSSVQRILQTSAKGLPEKGEIAIRKQLYELAAQYDIPLWMMETSEGPGRADYSFGSPENLRARANHIVDELVYANASAYFAMYNLWDRQSHEDHFRDRGIAFFSESSHIALVDQETSNVYVSGIGFAIGHFARWIAPDSWRIDAVSDNRLVKVVAFRSAIQNKLTVVVINNSNSRANMDLYLENMAANGIVKGEFSDRENRWQELGPLKLSDTKSLKLVINPLSVTSLSATLIDRD